jgi:glycosyltransferase involved in cell wall biosynthesis
MVESTLPRRRYDVLFSMPWAGPALDGSGPAGGSETQMVAIARGLAATGLKVAMLVVGDRSRLPRHVDGVHVLVQARAPAVRGLGGAIHDLGTTYALLRSRARVVVRMNAGRDVAAAAAAARLTRGGFVYSSASPVDFDLRRLDSAFNVRLYEWGVRGATQVVVQTDEQVGMCRSRFGREPVVIPSVAERARPRTAAPEAFLWVGRMAPYKRLEAYLDLAAAVPDARFRVVPAARAGEQPEIAGQLARAREELPNLEVLSPRPRAQLGPLIDRAVAIVNTSEFEGMPNVFLEGWARGVPALAFSYDPDGVVVGHRLGSFAGGSPDRLRELAREQWEARGDQTDVAARCIAYVRRHHDFEAVCEAWRALLVAVISARA